MHSRGLDFYDCDPEADRHLKPDCPESCMKMIRAMAHSMCDGKIPGGVPLRLGLLFSAMAKIALSVDCARREARDETEESRHEEIDAMAGMTMAAFVAACVAWAEHVEDGANLLSTFD